MHTHVAIDCILQLTASVCFNGLPPFYNENIYFSLNILLTEECFGVWAPKKGAGVVHVFSFDFALKTMRFGRGMQKDSYRFSFLHTLLPAVGTNMHVARRTQKFVIHLV